MGKAPQTVNEVRQEITGEALSHGEESTKGKSLKLE